MIVNGLWFGLFIIACGVLTVYPTLGKGDDEIVRFGSYALAEAKFVKIYGEAIIIGGLLVLLISLLL